MAEVLTRGYLVARSDYGIFDEILTFINEYGNKFVMFAAGTRKINSKNARALFFGNFLEIQFFLATNKTRLSKLKKVVCLNSINYTYERTYSLIMLSELMSQVIDFNEQWYTFYQMVLSYIISDLNDFYIACFLLTKFLLLNGISFNFKCCGYCGSVKLLQTLCVSNQCLVCHHCLLKNSHLLLYELKALRLWQTLINKNALHINDQVDQNVCHSLLIILCDLLYQKLGIYLACSYQLKRSDVIKENAKE